MPIVDLYGHDSLRARLCASFTRGTLPTSLLIHGPRGVGKQRLALWLGQLLICESPTGNGPCGACRSCRYAKELGHPDLHWYFPRPRPKDADPSLDEVKDDFIDAIRDRLGDKGIYPPPSGLEGIFIRTVHLIVQQAGMTPTLGSRKVFIIGDADRMVAQEGSDQAANAFLKLLEEPLPDTTVVLTTSEPAALLPTIRSRVIGLRANPLPDSDVRAFLGDPLVTTGLQSYGLPKSVEERVRIANGAPGALLNSGTAAEAHAFANEMLAASRAGDAERFRLGLAFGSSKARGFFSDVLDALTALLHSRTRERAAAGDDDGARRAATAVRAVEKAKFRASGNVNPQLIGSALLKDFAELRP
jgi:DNA polymerase III subunit delta'